MWEFIHKMKWVTPPVKPSLEIEKKFLLREEGNYYANILFTDTLVNSVKKLGAYCYQGYLHKADGDYLLNYLIRENYIKERKVCFAINEYRLREKAYPNDPKKCNKWFFAIKSSGSLIRYEVEVEIQPAIFDKMWDFTNGRRVEKFVYSYGEPGNCMEIANYIDRDLVIVEFETPSKASANMIEFPGRDVTEISDYKNINLAR